MQKQPVIGGIDFRIACNNAVDNAVIALEAVQQVIAVNRCALGNTVFTLIINIRLHRSVKRTAEGLAEFLRIIDRICIDDIPAPVSGNIHAHNAAEENRHRKGEKKKHRNSLISQSIQLRFFRFCSQSPTPPSDILVPSG